MGDSTENNPLEEEVESVGVTKSALSGAKPPTADETEATDQTGSTTKEAKPEETNHDDETPTVHANPDEDLTKTDDPENKTDRVETTTETEYETTEGGVKKLVKSSVKETKEFSHKVHRTVYNDSPDSTSAMISEFPDLPRPRPKFPSQNPADYKQKLPRTPVISTVRSNSPRPVFIERTIDTSRTSDGRSRATPISVITAPSTPGQASIRSDKDMSRIIDGETYELIRDPSTRTHVIRNAKNISDVLSEELKTSRKQYEYMLTKTVHMESTIRELHEKLKDYRNRYKQLSREVQEHDALVDKLHEAHSQLRRLQRYLEKVEDERSTLIKDYEILRQSHNRKEQQLHGYTTERAELLRRLDLLEYEKQQLQYQLMDSNRKDRSMRYHSGSLSSRKTHKYRKTMQQMSSSALHFNDRSTHSPYGELPVNLQADLDHIAQSSPVVSGVKHNEADENEETNKEPGWSVNVTETNVTGDAQGEAGDDQTLIETPTGADNRASPSGNVDTLTADDHNKPETIGDSQIEEAQNVSPNHRSRIDGKSEDMNDRPLPPSAHSPQAPYPQHRHRGKVGHHSMERTGYHLSATDSQEEDIEAPFVRIPSRILESYDSPRHTLPRSSYIKRRSTRQAGDFYTAHSMDYRGESYCRYKRPASAYGYIGSRYAPRDYEVYPSPLPPRSTTSFGRIATIERLRSPDREYSRMRRSPVRKSHIYVPLTPKSPDPFRYEPLRSSRGELAQLEAQLEHMKREKRRLEKQFTATQTATSLTENLKRREELLNRITRLAGEIRHLQLQVSRMY